MTLDSNQALTHPALGPDPRAEGPKMVDYVGNPQAEDRLEDRREENHLEDHQAEGP